MNDITKEKKKSEISFNGVTQILLQHILYQTKDYKIIDIFHIIYLITSKILSVTNGLWFTVRVSVMKEFTKKDAHAEVKR